MDELGFELEIRILPDAVRTAQAAADALGCAVGQIANSLIFRERNLDQAQTGFAIGGVPPLAHESDLRTLLDDSLQRFDEIWAAAGTPESVFCMNPEQLQSMTGGSWHKIAASK